jgi:hypothetical protein
MRWGMRAAISVSIPLLIGVALANLGVHRSIYKNAVRFWESAGLYDSTPVRTPSRYAPRPLDKKLRYVTEGAIYSLTILPAFLLAIFIFDRLTYRYSRDHYLRCPACGHILAGLSEPRCPECGRPI